MITSRPSAASQLYNIVSCRIEILGFINSDRQKVFQESLKDSPERAVLLEVTWMTIYSSVHFVW